MKTILVPTDFSRNARNAIRFALALAQPTQARLVLYNVCQVPAPVTEMPMVLLPDYEIRRLTHNRMKVLVRDVRKLAHPGTVVEGVVENGGVTDRISHFARHHHVDLVVMGTRGANNLLDRLIGTNTAALMKQAPCPVLAIPAKARYKGLDKVVYASDHLSQERVFSSFLYNLAKRNQSEVVVLNIKKDVQFNVGNEIEVPLCIRAYYPYDQYQFVSVVSDSPEKGVAEYVKKKKPHLLALTVRKRGALEEFFRNSLIKSLAYQLPTPILALPEETIQEQTSPGNFNQEDLAQMGR